MARLFLNIVNVCAFARTGLRPVFLITRYAEFFDKKVITYHPQMLPYVYTP
jgi:hypothetical protein